MSEKRFVIDEEGISDNKTDKWYCWKEEVVDLLNEQQELIEELHISDHMGWGRAEKFEKELKQKKIYIKRLEYKVQKFKEMNGEQQATIQRMKHSLNTIYKAFEKHYGYDMRNAVWLIDELSYDEIVDELYIAETDSKNRKEASMYWKKKVDEQQATNDYLEESNSRLQIQLGETLRLVDEQQATIRRLQDLCGKSDGENMKLQIENKRLQKELNDCEKFRYQVFKRLNDEHIKECSIK